MDPNNSSINMTSFNNDFDAWLTSTITSNPAANTPNNNIQPLETIFFPDIQIKPCTDIDEVAAKNYWSMDGAVPNQDAFLMPRIEGLNEPTDEAFEIHIRGFGSGDPAFMFGTGKITKDDGDDDVRLGMLYDIDSPISRGGDSGSGVVDEFGRLVGLLVARGDIFREGRAVPTVTIRRFLQGWLDVDYRDLEMELKS
jgi:hypothetical protein